MHAHRFDARGGLAFALDFGWLEERVAARAKRALARRCRGTGLRYYACVFFHVYDGPEEGKRERREEFKSGVNGFLNAL